MQYRPFCSQRCAMVDLGRWFGGNYRVPTDDKPEDAAPGTGADGGDDER